jgi:hypothetical protein
MNETQYILALVGKAKNSAQIFRPDMIEYTARNIFIPGEL